MKDFHRGAYHRYFEGFTETSIVMPNGKTRIERIYTGYLYTQNISDHLLKRHKILYSLAYIAYIAVLICCGTIQTSYNETWYVAFPVMLSLFSIIWYTPSLFTFLFSGRQLIARQHRSVVNLKNIAIICGICFSIAAVSLIVYSVITLTVSYIQIISVLLYIGVATAFFTLYKTESKIDFSRCLAHADLADVDNSYEIKF